MTFLLGAGAVALLIAIGAVVSVKRRSASGSMPADFVAGNRHVVQNPYSKQDNGSGGTY